jgi:hypothetical protein
MSRKITITRTFDLPDYLVEEIQSKAPFHTRTRTTLVVRSVMQDHMPAFSGVAEAHEITQTLISDGSIALVDDQLRTRTITIDDLSQLPSANICYIKDKSPYARPVHLFAEIHKCIYGITKADVPVWALRDIAQQMVDDGLVIVEGIESSVATDQDVSSANKCLVDTILHSRKMIDPA